ncbi:hypothetical protein [Pseudoalteromonas aurantia]|uniref:Uncharacterized protein n=1 Tax=Pseudoalteromonas aurantia TaxID=43654 RepID=A0ABY2VRU5_9GAMM|nr:hypothetical protein [Pseudoalteromonas aurantia]TMO68515.1 hypothetical protein CWC20_21240 [Pseudoalteromonas aurantia]
MNADWSKFLGQTDLSNKLQENHYKHEASFGFRVFDPPTYLNDHLKAQQGVFTCQYEFGIVKSKKMSPICLKKYITNLEEEENSKEQARGLLGSLSEVTRRMDGIVLYEFKLPASKAYELLGSLDKLGINASTIFPTISGCVKTIFERTKVY